MVIKYIFIVAICCNYLNPILAQTITTQLKDNQILTSSISAGSYNYYYFSTTLTNQLFRKRDQPTIHLSIAACTQPTSPPHFNDLVPSLEVYISSSNRNTLPGPSDGNIANNSLHGLVTWASNDQTSEIWIAVGGPKLTGAWTGNWTYEIGVSTNQFMHLLYVNDQEIDNSYDAPYVTLDDTDRNHALFLSNPFQGTQPNSTILMAVKLPKELSHSMCAANLHKMVSYQVNTTITYRGPTNATRQQFLVSNLIQDTDYTAYMLQTRGSVVGMTTPIYLSTNVDANCRIIYDLPFCDQVAYSVPVNPDALLTADIHDLVLQYDQQAQEKFEPFSVALSQYNCETTQYSLVRNCTDCYRDYKTWLCAVAIPRCTDSTASADLSQDTDDVPAAPALHDVQVNASRNPWIDKTMRPGGWTELLPCIDLCYHVVQSCPPFLQFYCPEPDLRAVQYGYWQNGTTSINGTTFHFGINNPTCNRMGVNPGLLTISGVSSFNHLFILHITPLVTLIMLLL
ncbi:MAG: stretch-activated Ca2+-permeable channel component-domain-containing protein [Benjaminiella poitrasii]|nr:MAG: stretch-activated Ca2+-permeable channel component-domain-containing protein [Benjaminiella poitrasii]